MKHLLSTFVLLLLCLPNYSWAQKPVKKAATPAPDVAHLMSLFKGEFDNFKQVHKEREDSVAEKHEHIHSVFAPVSLPTLGPNVLYVKQYMDGDPSKIYRQRLYSFVSDPAEKAVRLDIYTFDVDSLYYDVNLHPEKLANLTPAKLTNTPGCAVYWKREGEQYGGYMKDKGCSFISKRSGKKIFVTDSLLLDNNQLWIRDEAFDEAGNYIFGHKGRIHHKLMRTATYKGWFALEKKDTPGQFESSREVVLHDQGGRQRLMTKAGTPTNYTIELANVIYGKNQDVLKLALYEEGNPRAIDYVWASPGAKLIGINLRWFSAGMTRQE